MNSLQSIYAPHSALEAAKNALIEAAKEIFTLPEKFWEAVENDHSRYLY